MRIFTYVGFLCYYVKLRLQVWAGFRHTANPLGVGWRWKHYQRMKSPQLK